MQEGVVQYLAQVLRGLAAGSDPARLLSDAASGAVAAVRGRHGVIFGLVDGSPTVVAATGTTPRIVREAADACMADNRMARRRDPDTGGGATAEPIRIAGRVVGAIAIGGEPLALDAASLPLFADAAGLALSRGP